MENDIIAFAADASGNRKQFPTDTTKPTTRVVSVRLVGFMFRMISALRVNFVE